MTGKIGATGICNKLPFSGKIHDDSRCQNGQDNLCGNHSDKIANTVTLTIF